jgi:hypothetical protein
MNTQKSLLVLFDGMIVTQAIPTEIGRDLQTYSWGPLTLLINMFCDVPRIFRNETRERTVRAQEYLSRVADLARSGRIIPYSSQEIKFETMGRPRHYSLAPEDNPFWDIGFERCQLPLQRTVTFGGIEDRFEEKKEKALASITDVRFRELDRVTGGGHSADCYHLWTAEVNRLDVFLTREGKFKRAFQGQKKITSTVEIMWPEELCALYPGVRCGITSRSSPRAALENS